MVDSPLRILVSWIGHTDLAAYANASSKSHRLDIERSVKQLPKNIEGIGPIKTLTNEVSFDQIHLLSNYPRRPASLFGKWIGENVTIHPVSIKDPTNYEAIFRIADSILNEIVLNESEQPVDLAIHLSPGTPAMTSIWVLLGKSRYPATFYQTYNCQVQKTDIPFDLVFDFIPEVLRGSDARLQHLVASAPKDTPGFEDIIGDSPAIREAVGRARRAAIREVSVLLLGESGTGKEMFARAIHQSSPRHDKPFITLNCGALPSTLLESELFGHVKGAFTGAHTNREGAFEQADTGTLFLDEIGECNPDTQVKLLRVLQPPPRQSLTIRKIRRVGDRKEKTVDVRIIAATNRQLHKDIQEGRFREDLFYRLAVLSIRLPPLRERDADAGAIAGVLLDEINQNLDGQPGYNHKIFSDSANIFVRTHQWPGNVRQLYNAILQAAVLTDGGTIDREDLAASLSEGCLQEQSNLLNKPLGNGFSIDDYLEEIRFHYLKRAMNQAGGVKSKAAKLLGLKNYQTLSQQLKRLGAKYTG